MTGARATADSRDGSKPWLIAGAACALAATGALMLTDEARWLRLGIIAALWAALLGAFLATKYRRSAENAWDSVADAQHIYELELEREITARREYELELEASTRRRVEQEAQSEIQDLRTEVMALRDSLQQLLGGELVYERVALTEQSTRRRSMREEQNGIAPGEDGAGRRVVSGRTTALEEVADQRTQVISRVVATSGPSRRGGRPPVADEARYEPFQREPRQATAYEAFPAEQEPEPYDPEPAVEQARSRYYRAELPVGSQQDDEYALPEHPSASEFSLADYANGASNGSADAASADKYEFPAFSVFDEDDAGDGVFAANENGANGRHQPRPSRPPHDDRSDTGDLSAFIGGNRAADQDGGRAGHHAADQHEQWPSQQPEQEHSWFTPASPVAANGNGHAGGAHREPEPATNHSLPPGAREIQRQGKPGGRRRKPEPDESASSMAPVAPSEPVVPETPTVRAVSSGQDDYSFPGANGKHVSYQPEPSSPFAQHAASDQSPPPRSRQPMQEENTGSHANGRSVHDLLAAHGRSAPTRRHRYKD